MKVAMIKQLLDTFGPWSSVRWGETSPIELFRVWPGKAVYWEMTTLLKADWYVVPQRIKTDYTYDSVLRDARRARIVKKYTAQVTDPADIPFDSYDIIISLDPVLEVPPGMRGLFGYYLEEHWDRRYRRSVQSPLGGYDLFLAHMMDARSGLQGLPQAISFPYLRDPQTTRSLFAKNERRETVWADWRTLATLSAVTGGGEDAQLWMEATARRLEETLNVRVTFRRFRTETYHGYDDPPRWGDAVEYLRELGKQKYYLSLGRGSGAGQGLVDAASLGCLCFGEENKPYHRLMCHPEALCGDLQELPRRVRRVRASEDLQNEVFAWQEDKLRQHFTEGPLKILRQAVNLKQGCGVTC